VSRPRELRVVGEPEDRRAGREVGRRRGSRRRHRLDEHTEEARGPGDVPDGQGHPAAGTEHPGELGGCALGTPEVQHHEVGHDRVKAGVVERERLGVAAAELEPRMEPASELEHALGDVHADHGGTAVGGPRSHVPGARGDVQHASFVADRRGIEQPPDQPRRDRPEERIVAGDLLLPARRLERIERVRIDRRLGHGRPILRLRVRQRLASSSA
jgi:hypothetical protein